MSSVKQKLGKRFKYLPIAEHVSYKENKLQTLVSSQCQVGKLILQNTSNKFINPKLYF